MASSQSFEWVSQELERITSLDRLEARGTMRLVLKKAGLDASTVTAKQMEVVLRQLLPGELQSRGVEDGGGACERLLRGLSAANLSDTGPSAESPEAVFRRLGGS
jgi:hypothetical protein